MINAGNSEEAIKALNCNIDTDDNIFQVITKEKKTHYTYETEENEAKRTIKLLKPEFVSAVEKEFKKIIKL